MSTTMMTLVRTGIDQRARRTAAALVLAAAPLLYAVPAGAAQYSQLWQATFASQTGLQLLQAGMAMSCLFIPLAPMACIPLSLL